MAGSTYPLLLATYAVIFGGANGATLIEHLAATTNLAELNTVINTPA